jgi:hypothetical protein
MPQRRSPCGDSVLECAIRARKHARSQGFAAPHPHPVPNSTHVSHDGSTPHIVEGPTIFSANHAQMQHQSGAGSRLLRPRDLQARTPRKPLRTQSIASQGRRKAARERAPNSAVASERLCEQPSMTGHDRSVTHVSGINRNLCVRNGPSDGGALGGIRTPDPQIRSLVLLTDTTTLHLPQSSKMASFQQESPTQAALPRHELALSWLLDGS